MSTTIPQIILPRIIYRSFVQANPNWIFVYGDNMMGNGMLGQPWHMSGEPNAFSVPTCVKPCKSNRYFSDEQYEYYHKIISASIELIPKDTTRPILVLRRIGEGCSRLSELCPKLFSYMTTTLNTIKYPNYDWDWNSQQNYYD